MKLLDPKEFGKLTKLEKRVAIARDVVARLNAKKLRALPLEIFSSNTTYLRNGSTGLQNAINSNTCEACAKGALCISYIGNFNHYENLMFSPQLYNVDITDEYPKELLDIFGKKLLDVIEIAFESRVFRYTNKVFVNTEDDYWYLGEDRSKPACQAIPIINEFKDIKNANRRMKVIFQNIIDNGGKLKIGDKLYG